MSPAIARISVVLPAPLAPSSATILPAGTLSDTCCRTRTRPYPASRSRTSSIFIPFAEVGIDNLWIVANLGRRPLCENAALMHHGDPRGKPHHDPHIVLDDHERDGAFAR